MQKKRFVVEGMSCGGCVKAVTSVLRRLPGVEVDEVTIGAATVHVDPQKSSGEAVAAALTDAGFPAHPG